LAVAMILMAYSQNVVQLFIFRVLQGALSGFYPAALALAVYTAPKDRTGYALGIIQSASTSGTVIGPLLGGFFSQLFGFRSVFLIVGAIILVCAFLVLIFLKEEKNQTTDSEPTFTVMENWKLVISTKELLIAGFLIFMSSLAVALLAPIFVLYVETFNVSVNALPLTTGVLYSILGLFATVSSVFLGKQIDVKGVKKNLLISSIIIGGMYFLHYFVYQVAVLIPIRIVLGLGIGILIPVLFTALSKSVPLNRKAGIMGIGSSFQILGNMIGPVCSGFLGAAFGVRYAFLLAGLIFLFIGVVTQKFVKD